MNGLTVRDVCMGVVGGYRYSGCVCVAVCGWVCVIGLTVNRSAGLANYSVAPLCDVTKHDAQNIALSRALP